MVKIYPHNYHYKNKNQLKKEDAENKRIVKFIFSYYFVVFIIFGMI